MINIVFIDDERINEKVWHKYLRDVNFEYEITIYESPKQALSEMVEFGNNTIIILDMNMPELHGEEFLHRIRNNNIHIPVIVYSGNVKFANNSKFNQLIKDNIFTYIEKTNREEVVISISAAADTIRDAIPLELSEALSEFLEKRPERKNNIIMTKSGEEFSFAELEKLINSKSEIGVDYQKALYKMSFDRLLRREEKL